MAQTPYSLLLLKRLSRCSPSSVLSTPALLPLLRPFSTSPTSISSSDPKPSSSLSARLSFVFDQIDAIEKERSEKDQTLQKIRAWRESKKSQNEPELGLAVTNDNDTSANLIKSDSALPEPERRERPVIAKKEVEVVHPWPEWIELMERLVQQNYFDHRRMDEDRMVQDIGFEASEAVLAMEGDAQGVDFNDYKAVHTACLNFGKDRFDIMRSLSRQDIQLLVGFGCPSTDKKVVFSSKLLRKHTHLDEGDVCSSCSLRNSCERAYLITNKEDEARTIDIMRVLFAYGFDPVNGSVVNKSVLKQRSVKTVVRKLLHQVVKLSAVPIDPNLPPPVIKKPPPKVKQPPPPPRRRVGRDDIEMKKGDWLCSKCDFMNFAKNTICLQCDAKRPKRQLLPGEWECPGCNFLNYRRNMACFHCDCKRPPDEYLENKVQERQHGPRTRMDKPAVLHGDSNAWNFDFDDNESDGADVAAFEHADSTVMGEGSLGNQAQGQNFRRPEYNFSKDSRVPRVHNEEYSDAETVRPQRGFDDFDDEDDDIDNYELDTHNKNSAQKASVEFSEFEGSESEDIEESDNSLHGRRRTQSPSYNKQSKSARQWGAFSLSDDNELDVDSDKQLSVHPNWKSSHVADSRSRGRGRNTTGPSKGLSFGSDDEVGLYSDDDDLDQNFGSRQGKLNSGRKDFQRRGNFDIEDDSVSGSDSDDDNSHKNRPRRNTENFKGRGSYSFMKDTPFESNRMKGGRRNSLNDDFDRSTRGPHGNSRGFRGNDFDGQRMSNRGGDAQGFKGPRKEAFGKGGRRDSFNDDFDRSGRESRGTNKGFRGNDFGGSLKGPKRDGFGKGGRRDSFNDDFDRPSRESRGNNKGFRGSGFTGQRMSNRGDDSRNFKGHRREGYGRDNDKGFDEFPNSRRVIER